MDARTVHSLNLFEVLIAPTTEFTKCEPEILVQRLRGRGKFLLKQGRIKDAELMFDAAKKLTNCDQNG